MTSCDQQQRRNAMSLAIFVLLKIDIEEEKCIKMNVFDRFFSTFLWPYLFFTQKLMYEHRSTL